MNIFQLTKKALKKYLEQDKEVLVPKQKLCTLDLDLVRALTKSLRKGWDGQELFFSYSTHEPETEKIYDLYQKESDKSHELNYGWQYLIARLYEQLGRHSLMKNIMETDEMCPIDVQLLLTEAEAFIRIVDGETLPYAISNMPPFDEDN
jgi:hypothetical protein